MDKRKAMEQEREKLHRLIEEDAAKEAIQHQSEVLDRHISDYYKQKGA